MKRPAELPPVPDGFPVKKIPAGVRAIPLKEQQQTQPRFAAETCGSGGRVWSAPHLDEIDGDTFK